MMRREKSSSAGDRLRTYEEALEVLLTAVTWRLPTEAVPVVESLGRVLRENVKASFPLPPFARSAMDGYAVRAEDTASAQSHSPVVLEVKEEIPAGKFPRRRLRPGEASRIMTGAPLPAGADAVVMVEETESLEDGRRVRILAPTSPAENVGAAGEDLAKGEVALAAGRRIGPAEMGLLSSLGRSTVKVSRRPQLALFSTGDEVQAPGTPLRHGHIYDANSYSLAGLALQAGAVCQDKGIIPDEVGIMRRALAGCRNFDLIVLSGGVSVGDYDFVSTLLRQLDFAELFYQAAIQPGKPTFTGRKGKQLVFGLPGNPVSCMVCFHLFVRPVIDKLTGAEPLGLRRGRAVLENDFKLRPGRRKFLRGEITNWGPELRVRPFPNQKSGVLTSMRDAHVLIDVPGDVRFLSAGTVVEILWL